MRAGMLVAGGLIVALAGCGDDDGEGGGTDAGGGGVDSGGGGVDSGGGGTDSGGGGTDSGGGGDDAGSAGAAGRVPDAGGMMCAAMGTDGCAMSGGTACCAGLMCCAGVPLPEAGRCIGGSECPMSDRNIKHGFASVSPEEILARVASLEISTWSYDDEPNVRHMGPMAQDFAAAFEVGADDRHIHVIDMNGVSTAAIQALHARTENLARENEQLRQDNAEMRDAVRRIEARIGGGR